MPGPIRTRHGCLVLLIHGFFIRHDLLRTFLRARVGEISDPDIILTHFINDLIVVSVADGIGLDPYDIRSAYHIGIC